MDKKSHQCLTEFFRICVKEMDAGNCKLTEAEASAVIDTMIRARRRELDPQSEAAMMRRIAEGYLEMAQKVDDIKADVEDIKKGKVIKMSPRH